MGTTLVFDTEFVPSRVAAPSGYNFTAEDYGRVNVSACVFHEAFKSNTGVTEINSLFRTSTGDINRTSIIQFNDKGEALRFNPSDTVTASASTGSANTTLWPNRLANQNPQFVPFDYTPSDIFTISALKGIGEQFLTNPQDDSMYLTEYSGSLSFWMVEDT